MSGLRLFAQQGFQAVAASLRAGHKAFCRKLVWGGGELLRNVQVYLGKSIDWMALHSFGLNEEC